MYPDNHLEFPTKLPVLCSPFSAALLTLVTFLTLCGIPSFAQSSTDDANPQQNQQQQQQDQVPAAGGPTGESGPIAVPKKNTDEEPPPPPPRPKVENPEYSLH